eukprot:gene6013-8283_t
MLVSYVKIIGRNDLSKKNPMIGWFRYNDISAYLKPLLKPDDKILIIGCGNSSFSSDLYDDGYTNIINIDFSTVVIEHMRTLHDKERPLMTWHYMDMTDLTFESSSFDIILDKAAMDAIMVDEGDVWDPNESTINMTHKMCQSIQRVLKKKNGKYIQISFAQPHFRTKYLMGYNIIPPTDEELSHYKSYSGLSILYSWDLLFEPLVVEGGCLNSFLYVMITNDESSINEN